MKRPVMETFTSATSGRGEFDESSPCHCLSSWSRSSLVSLCWSRDGFGNSPLLPLEQSVFAQILSCTSRLITTYRGDASVAIATLLVTAPRTVHVLWPLILFVVIKFGRSRWKVARWSRCILGGGFDDSIVTSAHRELGYYMPHARSGDSRWRDSPLSEHTSLRFPFGYGPPSVGRVLFLSFGRPSLSPPELCFQVRRHCCPYSERSRCLWPWRRHGGLRRS